MSAAHVLYHMVKADFLERVRRYSFLLTLGMALYLGYLTATGKLMLRMGHIRGIYNSAWIGGLMSMGAACFISLAGFYVVKNTIQRDRDTRVGPILAATPMTKLQYLLGKTISNFVVLATMTALLAVAGVGMQYWRGEDLHLEIWQLLSPFLLLALPMMAMVAAVAVMFETIPFLSGGFGNILYFFVWTAGLTLPLSTNSRLFDPTGLFVLSDSMLRAAHLPLEHSEFSLSLDGGTFGLIKSTFRWQGIHWSSHAVLLRLAWFGVALLLVGVTSFWFDRFQSSRRPLREKASITADDAQVRQAVQSRDYRSLQPLASRTTGLRLGTLLSAELRLMLKGNAWWWYLVAAGLFIGGLCSPTEASRGGVLVAAWIWPMLLWSQMGVREARNNTGSLIFSSAHALARQLTAVWLAGVLLAALTGGGTGFRLLFAADWYGLAAWAAGALFIPSMALALGVWSGTPKLFEAVYTVWWYVGPAHHTPGIDFAGTAAFSASPARYFVLGVALLAIAYAGRRSRMAYA